jgi:hypothetical protein
MEYKFFPLNECNSDNIDIWNCCRVWQPNSQDWKKLLNKKKLQIDYLDVHCVCKTPECFALTQFDERGNNNSVCNKHYHEYKKKQICMKRNCNNKMSGSHLFCSTKCSFSSIYDKKEDLFWLEEVEIIRKYCEIINNLRRELYKTKIQLITNSSKQVTSEYVVNSNILTTSSLATSRTKLTIEIQSVKYRDVLSSHT